jgi:hypothetical protein
MFFLSQSPAVPVCVELQHQHVHGYPRQVQRTIWGLCVLYNHPVGCTRAHFACSSQTAGNSTPWHGMAGYGMAWQTVDLVI